MPEAQWSARGRNMKLPSLSLLDLRVFANFL